VYFEQILKEFREIPNFEEKVLKPLKDTNNPDLKKLVERLLQKPQVKSEEKH